MLEFFINDLYVQRKINLLIKEIFQFIVNTIATQAITKTQVLGESYYLFQLQKNCNS